MDAEQLPISAYDLDDDLIAETRRDGRPRLRIYRPQETMVVLGRGSKPELEIDADRCAAEGIALFKRRGGGCSVVLDPGNIVISLVLPVQGIGKSKQYLQSLTGWVIEGLEKIGIHGAQCDGISDLVLDGRKLGGSCLYRSKEILFYSATLLVSPDLGKIDCCLKHPPREPDYRAGRAHGEFLGALSPRYWSRSAEELTEALRGVLLPGAAVKALKE